MLVPVCVFTVFPFFQNQFALFVSAHEVSGSEERFLGFTQFLFQIVLRAAHSKIEKREEKKKKKEKIRVSEKKETR